VEEGLEHDLTRLVGLVDWVTKLHLLDGFRKQERLKWNDPWLEAQDLEYHQIDPARSLGLALADLDGPWSAGLDDAGAWLSPPSDTRAKLRSSLMRKIAETSGDYEIDWHRIEHDSGESVLLLDPFETRRK
jgi:proteasome accessory factor A